MKALDRISMTYVGYVCLLLGFVALGTFVYALAAGSPLAWLGGAALIAAFTAAVAGFRAGARKSVGDNDSDVPFDPANILAQPLRRAETDRYLRTYRDAPDVAQRPRVVALAGGGPAVLEDRRAA